MFDGLGESKFGSVSCENNKRLKIFHLDPFDYQCIVVALKGCSGLFYTFEPPQDQPDYDVCSFSPIPIFVSHFHFIYQSLESEVSSNTSLTLIVYVHDLLSRVTVIINS